MKRTSEVCNEIWRLDLKIWSYFYPEVKVEVEQPQESVVELWLHNDIVHILCDVSIDHENAEEEIISMLEESDYADAILKHCISMDKIL